MKILKIKPRMIISFIFIIMIFYLAGCTFSENNTIMMTKEIPITKIIEVTRISRITQIKEITKIIITTPTPGSIENTCFSEAVTQMDLNQCAWEEEERVRIILDNLIIDLEKIITNEQHEKLLQLQIAWNNLAQDQCKWETSFVEGGSIAPMWNAMCMVGQYEDRINDLRYYLCSVTGPDCEESLLYKQ